MSRTPSQKNQSHWNFSEIYNESWTLAKTHKELMILGALMLVFAQSGSNNIDLPNRDEQDAQESNTGSLDVTKTENRFDAITENVFELGTDIWQQTPANLPLVIGVEVIFLIVFGIIWSLIVSTWMKASLFLGVKNARTEKTVNIAETISAASRNIKPLLWLQIIPTLGIMVAVAAFFILGFILMGAIELVGGLYFLAGAVLGIYGLARLTTALNWASRHVVIQELSGKDGLKAGWKTAHKNILKTLGLGIANSISGGILTLLFFVPLAITGVIFFGSHMPGGYFAWWKILPLGVLGFFTFPVLAIFQAFWQVFTTATWQVGFEQLQKDRK